MPQPIRHPCVVDLSGILRLEKHAAMLGSIVGISGILESQLGHLLAFLTGTSASVAMAMFHSVTSTDAQKAMLTAAAREELKGAELDEFNDIMEEFRTRYGERSRLVHNVWGTSPQHPDKAVWCPAKATTSTSAKLAGVQEDNELDLLLQGPLGELWRSCSLYSLKDMQDVFWRLATYADRVREFTFRLQQQNPVIAARVAADIAAAAQAAAAAEASEIASAAAEEAARAIGQQGGGPPAPPGPENPE